MKIELEIDDKYSEQNIYVFAGIEIIQKRDLGTWFKKTEHCIKCGKCCMNVPADWVHGEKDGDCRYLTFRANEYLCKLGSNRPFDCCVSDGRPGECSIKWQEI